MSYTYTAKVGDTLNSIAQAHGFSNYKDAGIASVPSGNFDLIHPNDQITIGNYDPNKVSTVGTPTSPVLSSTDNTQQYKTDSSKVDTILSSLGGTKIDPLTGETTKTTDTTNYKTIDPVTNTYKTDTTADTTTGNAVFDNLQKEAQSQADALKIKQEQDKVDYTNMWNTSLANLNETTKATIDSINATYDKRVSEQNRINNINTARVQAYGLANGGQYTPIAFSDAVTNREQAGADAISQLNNERNALIDKAKSARDNGETQLMGQHLKDLQSIDDRINAQLKDVQATAEKNYQDLRNARVDAENQHKALVAEALTSLKGVAPSMADAYSKMDDTGKDATIKKIMAQTGLDYGSVYSTLEGAVVTGNNAKLDAQKKVADINAVDALTHQRLNPKTPSPKTTTYTAEQDLGQAMQDFQIKMTQKGWKGVSKNDYDQWYTYLQQEHGQATADKLQKYIDDKGLTVDSQ